MMRRKSVRDIKDMWEITSNTIIAIRGVQEIYGDGAFDEKFKYEYNRLCVQRAVLTWVLGYHNDINNGGNCTWDKLNDIEDSEEYLI